MHQIVRDLDLYAGEIALDLCLVLFVELCNFRVWRCFDFIRDLGADDVFRIDLSLPCVLNDEQIVDPPIQNVFGNRINAHIHFVDIRFHSFVDGIDAQGIAVHRHEHGSVSKIRRIRIGVLADHVRHFQASYEAVV